MLSCSRCQKSIPEDSLTCPACGAAIEDAPTRVLDSKGTSAKSTHTSTPHSYDAIDDARFVPGTILADRYRIVGLLGKGGMGEVYRADDLKLSQPVALKFLPARLLSDGAALARFHREVRIARQVSHKNVCRVYDIGETDGHHFLSMEYIKGEELSSLLRRIGRLPADKAVQLARQLCAGLAAAHDNNVLHRDLKPANVMIDENGDVRITDFGLAGLTKEFGADEAIAGTPAYMSPEQLAGKELGVTSDIYSLGLVLYEVFTGKKAFAANTLPELLKLRNTETIPATPSSLIKDIDPLVEQVILKCLDHNPDKRPGSALQVAAALPGGDPIAAALAAGETPSPEMVAAAPAEGMLKPLTASLLLLTFLLGIALICWSTKYSAIYRMTPLDLPPDALRARAREVIKNMGYTNPPIDSADGIILKGDYLSYIDAHDQSATRWDRLRTEEPGPYRFWYRQSPRHFETIENIEVDKPALDVSGMTSVYLDMKGRLHWFIGVPPQREPAAGESVAVDWSLPFREAGLDPANFRSVTPTSVPLHAFDTRAAWEGSDPSHPELKTQVEAAAFRGKLVYFETVYPWDHPTRQEEWVQTGRDRALTFIVIAVYVTVLLGSILLARRNLKLSRGDRRGATRLAFLFLTLHMLFWLFMAHHNGWLDSEFTLFLSHLSGAVFTAVFVWLLYVALEPFVRKRWPQRIISWSRLLAGSYRDPLVGRDVLIGAVFGVGVIACSLLTSLGMRWIGRPVLTFNPGTIAIGTHRFVEKFLSQLSAGIFLSFISLFLLLLFVMILRRERSAFALLWLLLTVVIALIGRASLQMTFFSALGAFFIVFVLYRYGLLATVSTLFVTHLWIFYSVTTEITAWYATDFVIALVICVAIAVFGFYISLAGRPVLSGKLLED
jgi:serine/threonine-protein kinase